MKAGRFIIFFSTFFLLFSSCEQELLDSPSFNTRGSYSTGQIAPPANLSATQGGYRSVTLSWEPSKSARQYFIYSSNSSTGTFTKFAETSDASAFFTYKEDSGVLKYYRVTAVDYYGTESAFSALCYGSTLSAPVITKIAKDSSGTAVTVYWYGGANCFESTYLNSLCYEILLFDVDGTTVLKEVVADGTESSCTFTNLVANTQYYFQVKAYIKSNQDESHTEMSDKVNESTAHRLIPDAPAELTVSKGVSQDGILLSWKLPSSVDVKSGADYVPHPVYFKVLRKELSEPDEAYKPISTYIGVVKGKDSNSEKKLEASEYRINCAEGTVCTVDSKGTEIITVTKPGDAEEQTNQYYPEYISGSTITFKDKTEVKIGKQYTYAVQSYTDDNGSKLMTSSDSIAVDSGWLITNPSLKMMSEFHYADDTKTEISEVTVSFTADFEDFGLTGTYKYVLYESFYKMDCKTNEQTGSKSELKEICAFDSINDILGYIKTYATEKDYYYYYMYELKICSSADKSLVYNSVKAPGSVLVVKDASKQPVIENFKAEGGYTEYFKLSWSYNEMYAYTLTWKNTDKNELVTDENTLDLLAGDENMTITEANGEKTAVYIHPAENGDRREYTLTAYNGMTDTETVNEVSTLRIPNLSFSSVLYDKIEVSWDKDDVSNGKYTVTAHYEDDPETDFVSNGEGGTSVMTITESNSRFTCTIEKPSGYDDPEKSGKPITLSVSTASFTSGNEPSDEKEKKDKTAVANITVCTLGPALTGTVIKESDKDSILVQWNEVQGASGYKIYRTKYASNGTGGWTPEKVDVYYKDAGTSGEFRISEGEGTIGKKTTCTSTAGVYTLRDAYADSYDDTNPYSVNQSQIAWGLPYSYTVIPVLSEDDFSGDIDPNTNKFKLSDTCKVAYNGIGAFTDKVKGSAFGYGLNLKASKASDTNSVSITWTLPYGYADKVPYLYRRSYNGNSAWSKVPVGSFTVSDNNRIGLNVKKDDSDRCEPFDYLVSYDPQTVSSVHNSFIEEIERDKNLDENGERACKGYAFTLPGITAKTGTGYSEEVYWEAYDYSKRAQGPESYEIFMRNDNKKDGWVKICTLNAGNNSQNATLNAETVDKGKYDIDLDFTGLSFTVKPSGIASGTASNTNGLLKVLRDAKHYYKIEAARKVGGTTDIRASYGDDKSVYAYRQITDEELVKSSLLVMAYAFYLNAGGNADLSNADSKLKYAEGNNLSSVNGGSAVFGGRSLLGVFEAGKYKADVSMTNYAPTQLTPAGVSSVMLGISMTNVSTRTKGLSDCYLDKFRTENFTVGVAPVDSELKKLSSYTNEFTMTCTGSGNLTVKINGSSIVSATSADVRRTWFPIQIDDAHCWLKDSSYGWWED